MEKQYIVETKPQTCALSAWEWSNKDHSDECIGLLEVDETQSNQWTIWICRKCLARLLKAKTGTTLSI